MKFCPNCGARLTEGVKFCTECGTKVAVPAPAPAPEPVYTAPVEPAYVEPKPEPAYVAPEPEPAYVAPEPASEPEPAPEPEPAYQPPVSGPAYEAPAAPAKTYTPQVSQPKAAKPVREPKEKKPFKKKLISIIAGVAVLVVLLIVLLVSCGGKDQGTEADWGVYKGVSCVVSGTDLGAEGEWVELQKKGKAKLAIMGGEYTAKWTLKGKQIILQQGGDDFYGTLKNGVLELDISGILYTFQKDGAAKPDLADKEQKDEKPTTSAPVGEKEEPEPEILPEPEPAPDSQLAVHENTFFTVAYDEAIGWGVAEDDFYTYDGGGNAYVRVLDEEGSTELVVYINAEEEDASAFRKAMYVNDFDLKAYAEGDMETTDVGGQPMLYVDRQNGCRFFFGRNEAAGVYYTIEAYDWEDPRVQALVGGITCTASGTDNVDPPWPWEGERFYSGFMSLPVGEHMVTAEFVPAEEPMITYETFRHDVEVIGSKVYLLTDYVLYEYDYVPGEEGGTLEHAREIPLDAEYETVESAGGDLVLSNFMEPVIGHDGSSLLYAYEGPDNFTVAPNGEWGISWFSSGEGCEKYTFRDGALVGEAFPFAEVKLISQVCVDEQYIYVTGSPVEGSGHFVFVYDHSGNLQMQLTSDPTGSIGLGSITYVTGTPNGFVALDGNMRDVVFWTADGTWLGSLETDDFFGTDYPWLASGDVMDDGSILCVMKQTRADNSADELLVFRISGF